MKICLVAGARPNFMKIAPIIHAIDRYNNTAIKLLYPYLLHTGQHYDQKMSHLFFEELNIPKPDWNLGVGSASHAVQTAEIMQRFETVCQKEHFSHVLVVGDVNSTIACALVASKLGIKVIHVEAGLRSFDREMPEEINRVLTDAISNILFTTEESANQNLNREGIPEAKIHFVGNVMIDTLIRHKEKAEKSNVLTNLGLVETPQNKNPDIKPYAVLTLHRPSNVDNKKTLQNICEALSIIGESLPIIFPVHPRTLKQIRAFNLETHFRMLLNRFQQQPNIGDKKIYCIEPQGYLDFLQLMAHSKLTLTDSGGIQEETTILGIPCITLRENTERPVTVAMGTNLVSGAKKEKIIEAAQIQLSKGKKGNGEKYDKVPPLWDGKAAERIVDELVSYLR